MPKGEYLGEFEQLVMLALARLEPRAYGMVVRQEIEERTGRSVAIGAVYATLERLEAKGYVHSSFGEPAAERGGKARRFFRVSAAGALAVQRSLTAVESMRAGLKVKWTSQ
jgi:DNA-binding PadR family transcriptional regulator